MKPRPGQKRTSPPPPASSSNAHHNNNWDQSHGTYISGRSYIDGVDAIAVRMERKWGCDRLRLLVSRELREKFDRQRYKLSAAIQGGQLVDVQREAERMVVAWSTLNKAADDAGEPPLSPLVWEVALPDGTVAAIVQDTAEAHAAVAAAADGRQVAVYSLDEIGRMLATYPGVLKAKRIWPGATVTRVEKTIGDPLDAIRQAASFDDPIDDLFQPSTN
jgi:hypothetical protein